MDLNLDEIIRLILFHIEKLSEAVVERTNSHRYKGLGIEFPSSIEQEDFAQHLIKIKNLYDQYQRITKPGMYEPDISSDPIHISTKGSIKIKSKKPIKPRKKK